MSGDTVLAVIRKNRQQNLRVGLSKFKSFDLLNLRVWIDTKDGRTLPSKAGLALRISLLPDLIDALRRVEIEARRLGLLDEGK